MIDYNALKSFILPEPLLISRHLEPSAGTREDQSMILKCNLLNLFVSLLFESIYLSLFSLDVPMSAATAELRLTVDKSAVPGSLTGGSYSAWAFLRLWSLPGHCWPSPSISYSKQVSYDSLLAQSSHLDSAF